MDSSKDEGNTMMELESEDTGPSETPGMTPTQEPEISTEEYRRRSFKRVLPNLGPMPTISKTFKNSANLQWHLQNIIKNVASKKPLSNTPHKPLKPSRSSRLTCVDFNSDGELIAVGDAGGQINVYHRNSQFFKPSSLPKQEGYRVLVAFDAHDQTFDVMTSCVGESTVSHVKWLKNRNTRNEYLLSVGHKTIKLWRVEQKQKLTYDADISSSFIKSQESDGTSSQLALTFPKVVNKEWQVAPSLRAIYGTLYSSYEFNSVSPNCDQETFLSADYVSVALWNLERGDEKTDLVNLTKVNGVSQIPDSLTDLIITAEFHPKSCNIFAYGSSNGFVRLFDMRQSSVQSRHKTFDGSRTNRFNVSGEYLEVVNSIRHLRFSPSGRYLMTRKYMSLEIWDVNMESRPIETYDVQEWIEPNLYLVCDMYDRSNDNFTCDWSFNERRVVSGAYNNSFRIVDRNISRNRIYKVHQSDVANPEGFMNASQPLRLNPRKLPEIRPDTIQYQNALKKFIPVSVCHPKENLIGLATGPNLYIYSNAAESK